MRSRLLAVALVVVVGLVVFGAWLFFRSSGDDASVGAASVNDPVTGSLGNGGYDVTNYNLDIDWRQDSNTLVGEANVDITATQELSQMNLDLAGLNVSSVLVDGSEVTFEHRDPELVIELVDTVEAGSEFLVTVAYEGTPVLSATGPFAGGWHILEDSAYVLGEPYGASYWFPSNDHPSDKATFEISVLVPSGETVVANGNLLDRQEVGNKVRWTYGSEEPMATYLTTVIVGDYVLSEPETYNGVRLQNVFPADATAAEMAIFDRHAEMIEVFSDLFGPYPFESYGGAIVYDREIPGALETQTLPVFGRGVDGDVIVSHELAHQWFGNDVTLTSFDEIWLNEGFATYASYLWFEFGRGEPIEEVISRNLNDFDESVNLLLPPGNPELTPEGIFAPHVYQRGALVLHALRLEVGDEVFFDILKTYSQRFGGGNVTIDEFVLLAEELHGDELDDLFQVWLYDVELPEKLGSIDLEALK